VFRGRGPHSPDDFRIARELSIDLRDALTSIPASIATSLSASHLASSSLVTGPSMRVPKDKSSRCSSTSPLAKPIIASRSSDFAKNHGVPFDATNILWTRRAATGI
jgi:hypothetical protein